MSALEVIEKALHQGDLLGARRGCLMLECEWADFKAKRPEKFPNEQKRWEARR